MVIAKFRLSSHCLTAEIGQYTGKKRNERLCKFCTETTEDEYHFKLEFPVNYQFRQ